jgi:hypothetical protein
MIRWPKHVASFEFGERVQATNAPSEERNGPGRDVERFLMVREAELA